MWNVNLNSFFPRKFEKIHFSCKSIGLTTNSSLAKNGALLWSLFMVY